MAKKREDVRKRLRRRYDMVSAARKARIERERPFRERLEMIFQSPMFSITDFWCDKCKQDCTGTGARKVCTVRETLPTAWYEGVCPKGHKIIRRITDKDSDPYYEQSPMVQRQRYELRDAFLTPDDPRFKLLYPKQYKELTKKK